MNNNENKKQNILFKENLFTFLKKHLIKTHYKLNKELRQLFSTNTYNDELFKQLEEKLLMFDVGISTTDKIINNLINYVNNNKLINNEMIYNQMIIEMKQFLLKINKPLIINNQKPFIILAVGVNGVGKTTNLVKLALLLKKQNKTVMLAAGDTFRSAAIEQLQELGIQENIPVYSQQHGADAASVIFDAIKLAIKNNIDILLVDTAGRLQNKNNLMEELKKIIKIIKKLNIEAPHEILLMIDANFGQNTINQTCMFDKTIGITGIILTKLDGTAKGGIIFALADQFNIPIRYIGIGEKMSDLKPFEANSFIKAFFNL